MNAQTQKAAVHLTGYFEADEMEEDSEEETVDAKSTAKADEKLKDTKADGKWKALLKTLALRCTMSVCLQFDWNRICTLNFHLQDVTDGTLSLLELPVGVREEFSGGAYSCEKFETQVQLVFGTEFQLNCHGRRRPRCVED